MAKMLKQVLRVATLLIGMAATSVALAVATVDVTVTGTGNAPGGASAGMGDMPKTEATTIRLVAKATGQTLYPDLHDRRFSVPEGKYDVEVFVSGLKIGPGGTVTFKEGPNSMRVDADTGVVTQPPLVGGPMTFPGFQLGYFGGSVGVGTVTDKAPTIGETMENPMVRASSPITTTSAHFGFPLLKDGSPQSVWDFGFMDGHRSTSTEVPTGTPAGYAFWIPTMTGVTGVSSSLGWNANLKTTYSDFNLNVGLPYKLKDDPPSSYWGVPMLGYQYSETKYNGKISNATVPGVSSTTNQKVKENDLRGGYGVRGMYTASNQIWVSGGVGLDAIYYWGRYNGSQDNVCPVCSLAAQNYSVSTNDSKSGLTFGAWADAAVGFPVSKDVDLFVLGTYRYDHAVATLVNNVTPTDQAPHLNTGDRNWASIEFGVRVKFNAP